MMTRMRQPTQLPLLLLLAIPCLGENHNDPPPRSFASLTAIPLSSSSTASEQPSASSAWTAPRPSIPASPSSGSATRRRSSSGDWSRGSLSASPTSPQEHAWTSTAERSPISTCEPDGLFVNREIVAKGYGFAYVKYPFQFMDDFRAAERLAREKRLGLWGPDPAGATAETTVYVTKTGRSTSGGCRGLAKSSTAIPLAKSPDDCRARYATPRSSDGRRKRGAPKTQPGGSGR